VAMVRRGRRIAFLCGVLAAAVLAAGVLGFRQRLVEEWYLWKLGSEDRAESDFAASKLAALSSLRAVEPLLLAIRRRGPQAISFTEVGKIPMSGDSPVQQSLLLPQMEAYALYQLGARALPAIESALKEESWADSRSILSDLRDAIQGKYAQVILIPSGESTWQSYPPLTSPSRGNRSPRK
jgi:hypothetical protein